MNQIFLECRNDNRALHSFPTRRSSDLLLAAAEDVDGADNGLASDIDTDIARSEEHTSELQSHHDLVCRLLLEKKNNGAVRRVTPLFAFFCIERISVPSLVLVSPKRTLV